MGDGHLPGQAEGLRAVGDLLKGEDARTAALMQMDVDALAVLLGKSEDHVEMCHRIAIVLEWVESADQIGTFAQGRVEKILTPFSRTMPACGNATICESRTVA